jgi:glycosyltransferase involved in cell wall biosynthesis
MKILYCISFHDENKAGIYRSFFNRAKHIANIIGKENCEVISIIKIDSNFLKRMKLLYNKEIYHLNKTDFIEDGVYCRYYKIRQGIFKFILWRLFPQVYLKKIYKLLQQKICVKQYDIIGTHSVDPIGYPLMKICKERNIPYVVTLHGSDINCIDYYNAMYKDKIIKAISNADIAFYVSNSLKDAAKSKGCNISNAYIVPNGINLTEFPIKASINHKQKLKLKGNVIGFIGNLYQIKRADSLPSIFYELYLLDPELQFIVIGDGPLRKSIENEVKSRKLNVSFYGRVSPSLINFYIASMDVVIIPSRNEGWPCVVLEAFATGVNVVGSNNGGISEVIEEHGFIVDEGQDFDKRFAKQVIHAITNKKDSHELIKYASKFDWYNLTKFELELLNELIYDK